MNNPYTILICCFFFFSCGTKIQYFGATNTATTEVEVFTNPGAIEKSYKEIGKGYVQLGYLAARNLETIQEKILKKAKQKGADAVLLQDYYIPNTGANIHTVFRTDSVGKAAVTTGTSSIDQTGTIMLTILFLKYR